MPLEQEFQNSKTQNHDQHPHDLPTSMSTFIVYYSNCTFSFEINITLLTGFICAVSCEVNSLIKVWLKAKPKEKAKFKV